VARWGNRLGRRSTVFCPQPVCAQVQVQSRPRGHGGISLYYKYYNKPLSGMAALHFLLSLPPDLLLGTLPRGGFVIRWYLGGGWWLPGNVPYTVSHWGDGRHKSDHPIVGLVFELWAVTQKRSCTACMWTLLPVPQLRLGSRDMCLTFCCVILFLLVACAHGTANILRFEERSRGLLDFLGGKGRRGLLCTL
jgi:hypothetical protein